MGKKQKKNILINLSCKKAQAGVEYMIIVGFITFAIISIFSLAIFYSGQIKDRIKLNQVENFAIQFVNSAESVFFAGEPSKTTIRLYLPEGVKNLELTSDHLIITVAVSSGENKRAYKSRVPIQGNISPGEGIKKLSLEAKEEYVLVS